MYKLRMPGDVIAGADALQGLQGLVAPGERICLLTDAGVVRAGLAERVLDALRRAGATAEMMDDVPAEPACQAVQAIAEAVGRGRFQGLVALGGGSVMDTAKLCAITADGAATVAALLEQPLLGCKGLRTIMIPTTAGTGAEATPNAIVAVPEKQMKIGIVNPQMIPDAVILDAEMIRHLPAAIAASTGVDALCHAMECYTSRAATPLSDLYALEALRLIFAHLVPACRSAEAMESKAAMLLAAFYGGMAIQGSGTTAVHALSYPLGGRYHIPHGVANAVLLMPVMRFNCADCAPRLMQVYDALGMAGASSQGEKAEAVLARMESMVAALEIPTDVRAYGVRQDDLEALVQAGMGVQRLLKNNRRTVTEEDARRLYQQILG